MDNRRPPLTRLAATVLEALQPPGNARLDAIEHHLTWLSQQADSLDRLRKRAHLCAHRGWPGAAKRVLGDLRHRLVALRSEITRCEERLNHGERPNPDFRSVLEELHQAEAEFGEIRYDYDERFLAVTTEPIELEGIHLGRFEIRLLLSGLADEHVDAALRVVALDPNPAATNASVSHPHVSDERVCTGDATVPLQRALAAGRLCDAFLLVRSVLETYNPGSPYVALDVWEGRPCYDCGHSMTEDDSYWCECCERDYCDGCIGTCQSCATTLCGSCLQRCSVCDEYTCESCLRNCSECRETCCPACLDEERCPACQNEEETTDEQVEEERPTPPGTVTGASESLEPVETAPA
jgi:hypothetical protein